ncbi:pitrilysin family protein [Synechococcus sp. CCY 9618]|uniref:M16 family metallopeptidase n=1 Tax=Synechococcus sp. CCY 9618 TaxID=2815602 RepID=UPI001C2342F5|nr:pitrilysin family protein [Synechococcus sp. CCY 9618]
MTIAPPTCHDDHRRLSGGLPLRVLHRPGPAILAARLAVPGGSGLDPMGQRGAHQLLAGTMTRGCGDLDADALADRVEGSGAALRVEAHEDGLVLALKCAAADASDLLPLLLAMARRPRLEPDQVAIERQLNLQLLQRQKEDPFQVAHDQLCQLLYGSGPYGHDPLGIEADLAGLGQEQLHPLVERLGKDGAVLVLCGDAPASLTTLLEQGLASAPWTTGMPAPKPFAGPPEPTGRYGQQVQDTEQVVLMLGAATVPLGHPDALVLRLLQSHLGMGMSSRLFVTMREERGLAYDVGVHLPARSGPTPFVMHLSTSAERAAEATTCLLEEWERILQEPLDGEARLLALAKFRGQDAMGRQTCSQIAERQALVLSHGLPTDHVRRVLERAPGISAQELRDAARRWLAAPCLSLVGPEPALAACRRAWLSHPLSRPGAQVPDPLR